MLFILSVMQMDSLWSLWRINWCANFYEQKTKIFSFMFRYWALRIFPPLDFHFTAAQLWKFHFCTSSSAALSLRVLKLYFRLHCSPVFFDVPEAEALRPPHWDHRDGSDRKAEYLREGGKTSQSFGDSGSQSWEALSFAHYGGLFCCMVSIHALPLPATASSR